MYPSKTREPWADMPLDERPEAIKAQAHWLAFDVYNFFFDVLTQRFKNLCEDGKEALREERQHYMALGYMLEHVVPVRYANVMLFYFAIV